MKARYDELVDEQEREQAKIKEEQELQQAKRKVEQSKQRKEEEDEIRRRKAEKEKEGKEKALEITMTSKEWHIARHDFHVEAIRRYDGSDRNAGIFREQCSPFVFFAFQQFQFKLEIL
jgi:hypothetical protein